MPASLENDKEPCVNSGLQWTLASYSIPRSSFSLHLLFLCFLPFCIWGRHFYTLHTSLYLEGDTPPYGVPRDSKMGEQATSVKSRNGTRSTPVSASDCSSSGFHCLTRRLSNLIVHSSIPIKAQVILVVVVLGSSLQASGVLPDTVFSDKYNPVNKYLVKFSWLWTCMWMLIAVSVTSALYSALTFKVILRHLGRVAVSHTVWYSTTTLIELLDNSVGTCSKESITSAKACTRGGHEWTGFDISGHIFLLSYCVFVITEEAANVSDEVWQGYNGTVENQQRVLSKSGTSELETWLVDIHARVTSFARALELFALLLVVIWSAMLVATSLYFHTFVEKLLGLLISVAIWYFTYGVLYGRSPYLPAKPQDGVLHPTKHI